MENDGSVGTRTASYLGPFMVDVFQAIEYGTAYCHEQFEKDKEAVQNTRLTDTIRYKTKLALEKKEYTVANIPMNGLHVFYKGYEIKIFKADKNGNVPVAGESKKRLEYYNHHYGKRKLDLDNVQAIIAELKLEDRRELILLYKLDRSGAFMGIDLVCTEKAEYQFGIPSLSWRNVIPHPVATNSKHDKYAEPPTGLDNIDRKDDRDLGISKSGTDD